MSTESTRGESLPETKTAANKITIASSTNPHNKNTFWALIQQQRPNNSLTLSGKREAAEKKIVTEWEGMLTEAEQYVFAQDTNQPEDQLQRNTVYLKKEDKGGQLHYRALDPRKPENVVVDGMGPTKQAILKILCDAGHAYVYEYLGPKFLAFQNRIHEQTDSLYYEEARLATLKGWLKTALKCDIPDAYVETILENRKKQLDFYNTELCLLCFFGPLALVGGGFMAGIGGAKISDPVYLKLIYAGIGLFALGIILCLISSHVDNKRIALEPWSPLAPLTESEIQEGHAYLPSN